MAQEENKDQPPVEGESIPKEPYDDDEKCDPGTDHGKVDPEVDEDPTSNDEKSDTKDAESHGPVKCDGDEP